MVNPEENININIIDKTIKAVFNFHHISLSSLILQYFSNKV